MLSPSKYFVYMLVYLFLLYIRPQEFIPALTGIPILPLFLLPATVLWAQEPKKDYQSPQFGLLLTLYFLMVWSLLKGGYFEEGFTVIGEFFPVVLLFYMLASGVNTLQRLRAVFVLIGIVMIVIAIHCIDESINGVGWTGAKPMLGRVIYLGFLSDPNDLSMALLMAGPMVLYTALRSGWFMRIVWLAGLGAMFYTIVLCNSRGAILALGAMAMHFSIKRFGLVRSLAVAPVLLGPLILFGPSRMSDMSAKEESAEGRVRAWEQGFLMFYSNPLFGVGKGRFLQYHPITAHNSYMLTLAELGSIGFVVWLSNIMISMLMAYVVDQTPEGQPPAPAVPKPGFVLPMAMKAAPPPEKWAEVQAASRVLWYGWTGGLSAMFFLSRSYTTIIYLHIALTVAAYQIGRRSNALLPAMPWSKYRGRLVPISLGAIVFLWLVTKKLR
jgi:putative inorganic carbon (HCO3(-)) transporter